MKPTIKFFGNGVYSLIVKNALIKADYQLVDQTNKADLIISADYGEKLPPGGLNLHPSLLPEYRGATPVPWQILNNEKQSGISIIQMTEEFDSGPIIAQEIVPIHSTDTTQDLLKRCFTTGAKLLISILPEYIEHKITPIIQPTKSPTPYCKKFAKQDGFIPFKDLNLKTLDRKIRALYPWPGVWTTMPNGKALKLLPNSMVQLEGKQPISYKQFLAGYANLLK